MCLEYIDKAADLEADLICFPEAYPGPFTCTRNFDAIPELKKKCKDRGVYVIVGRKEPAKEPNRYFTVMYVLGPDGSEVGQQARVMVPGPKLHVFGSKGADVPRDELNVFDTKFGKIGIAICSEVYCTEIPRSLALKGAEILFFPSGNPRPTLLKTWKALIWARAIENLAYTAACQHIWGMEDTIGMIASPEDVLVELNGEGIMIANLDLDRVKWLRSQEESPRFLPSPYKTMPGLSSGLVPYSHNGIRLSRRREVFGFAWEST
jgi:predicted amidohydrolase